MNPIRPHAVSRRLASLAAILLVATGCAAAHAVRVPFAAPAGALPANLEAASGSWKRAGDAPGDALLQDGKSEKAGFNVVLADAPVAADVDVTVELRAVDGEIDRGGGPVWRAQSGTTYYVARWNPLEDNFRVYHVVDGKRTQIGTADAHGDAAAWHTVRVRMEGDHIVCWFDGSRLLDVHDATLAAPGRVGLWTKADARTLFRELAVAPR